MAARGSIRGRLALAIVLTALIPVLSAILLARSMVTQTAERFFLPEIGQRLDQSLGLYWELATVTKTAMRAQATALAADPAMRRAAAGTDRAVLKEELEALIGRTPDGVSLIVVDADGRELARADRGRPLDESSEFGLQVNRPLEGLKPEGLELQATFATSRARFDELDSASKFVDTYRQVEQRRQLDERAYLYAFAVLLGITILAAVGVGVTLARSVSSRVAALAEATRKVAAGDLSTRVTPQGQDELTELARAFNRMLREVASSRARIEYFQRIGAWQEMARRLAHEIKNPLTPIQLAVQELGSRYQGDDPAFSKVLATTREIVEDEVGTLRRLVTEFSSFARLPQASLERGDLLQFLQEQLERLRRLEAEEGGGSAVASPIELTTDLPATPAPVFLDRQMLGRALVNLVRNAAEAGHQRGQELVHVRLRVTRHDDLWVLDIDDDGPGIPEELLSVVFDPYMTTKRSGTGLGLAIVEKIIVEHGGSILAERSDLGGARLRVSIPAAGTPASRVALEARDPKLPPPSRRTWGGGEHATEPRA